ncbi:sodium:calcium antiporter [Mucisphaera calidilacus]|uniref:Inner membrane protein YrbG n=1 Tax=Mucisphaera calidilacus TaxID=2527982 RepID=A0A518C0H2_9BACT|nr:sodium:calcium antiporter [Mucisphaera calidilacus]QDU72710.1 Inner membrane protein YrbG [Mucisphaera calidilacus]
MTCVPVTVASLLPHAWFLNQPQWLLLLFIVVALVVLVYGADWLVEAAAATAYQLGLPRIIVGATIVSLGTTSPEMAVSVLAAWSGNAGLALGNGVGSIIADTGLIFGIGCLMTALPADRFLLSRQGWVQFGSGALLAVACYALWYAQGDSATFGRPLGVLFVVLLVAYLGRSVVWARQQAELHAITQVTDEHHGHEVHRHSAWWLLFFGLLGLAMVVLGGEVMVQSASELAMRWGVPEVVIAGTLVAMGTSTPELVVGLMSIRKGHPELLVGNVIGADVLNVLFVIGFAALAAPLPLTEPGASWPNVFLELHLPTLIAMLVLFRVFIAMAVRRGRFSRWMGAPLVLMYFAYLVIQWGGSVG